MIDPLTMITCYNLSLEYTAGHSVLKDISIKIQEGSFHFLTGPSGAGKSSLLNVLSLAMQPTGGRLQMFGHDVSELPREALPELRRKIGTVYQDFQLLDHLTVAENIGLPMKVTGAAQEEINQRVDQLLDWIGMKHYHDMKPSALSGGEKQRTAIARAVINNPPFLIADEPSGNLDPHLSKRFMYLFESLNKMGTTIILATHDEDLIKDFSYPILHLKDGQLDELPKVRLGVAGKA